ncbi:MAG: hypothetical protein WCQ44_07640 [Opitutaceae bacterium]
MNNINCVLILNLLSPTFSLVGSIILAISLNKYLNSLDKSFFTLESSVDSLADILNNPQQKGFIVTGMENHRKKSKSCAKNFTPCSSRYTQRARHSWC